MDKSVFDLNSLNYQNSSGNIFDTWVNEIGALHERGADNLIADYISTNLTGYYKSSAFLLAVRTMPLGIDPKYYGFCDGITSILKGDYIGLCNMEYTSMCMKLETSTDSGGDRKASGDKTYNRFGEGRFKWSFNLIDGTSYFTIVNKGNAWGKMYLKLASSTDKSGDRQAYGDKVFRNEERFIWYVSADNPYENDIVIHSVRKGRLNYWMPLKLSTIVKDSDRLLWGEGEMIGYPSRAVERRYHWQVV